MAYVASFFVVVKGPGLALGAQVCPDQPQTFNNVKNTHAFPHMLQEGTIY